VKTATADKIVFPNRWPIYGLLNVSFILYVVVAAGLGPNANPRPLYLALLFAICSTPVLVLKKANDRFTSYAIFLGIYFVSYGVVDLIALTSETGVPNTLTDSLTAPELLIVLGGALFALGYQIAAPRQPSSFAVKDWPKGALLGVGLFLWTAGTYATWYWNIRLTVRAGEFNNNTGAAITMILMLGRYAQPLGLLVVAYAYTISRSAILTVITVAIAIFQVYLGFVSDTKGGAMLGGIMVIVTAFLVKGKIPKAWAVAGVLFILLAFPIFQAHRLYVVGERGASNANSVDNFSKSLQVSVDGQKRAAAEHAQSFFERSSVKSSVEMIVTKTGHGVPYQHGHTLIPLAAAFIPRLIWPEKLDIQTGQLVNTEFHVTGERVTYISPSCLGELYWNFGWIGGFTGMLLLGLLLGWINGLCDLSTHTSVTRLLILGITILQLGLRFEASIATEYSVWLRSIVAILFMHWLFARNSAARVPTSRSASTELQKLTLPLNRFPNLLR
jgi:hypothetical protein